MCVIVSAACRALMRRAPRTVVPIRMDDADAATFFTGRWFVQWQTETRYLKSDYNVRVEATYTQQAPSWFGYTVGVRNVARSVTGEVKDSSAGWGGCAPLGAQRQPGGGGLAKFLVAPQFVPRCFAGEYWIIARERCGDEELAVVCGGQPTIEARDGLYTYDTDATNNSGLWIFTRSQAPPNVDAIYARAMEVVRRNGISALGLSRVDQAP